MRIGVEGASEAGWLRLLLLPFHGRRA